MYGAYIEHRVRSVRLQNSVHERVEIGGFFGSESDRRPRVQHWPDKKHLLRRSFKPICNVVHNFLRLKGMRSSNQDPVGLVENAKNRMSGQKLGYGSWYGPTHSAADKWNGTAII